MTKSDLIEKISQLMPSKKDATIVVDTIFEEMLTSLVNGQKVVITGFGSFNLITTEVKKGRNPKTGVVVSIPAGKKISFKPTTTLRRLIQK